MRTVHSTGKEPTGTASCWARPRISTAKETERTQREPEASFRAAAAETTGAARRGAYLVLICKRGEGDTTRETHPTPHLFIPLVHKQKELSSVFSQRRAKGGLSSTEAAPAPSADTSRRSALGRLGLLHVLVPPSSLRFEVEALGQTRSCRLQSRLRLMPSRIVLAQQAVPGDVTQHFREKSGGWGSRRLRPEPKRSCRANRRPLQPDRQRSPGRVNDPRPGQRPEGELEGPPRPLCGPVPGSPPPGGHSAPRQPGTHGPERALSAPFSAAVAAGCAPLSTRSHSLFSPHLPAALRSP